jgi:large subunit ribosomal protein L29
MKAAEIRELTDEELARTVEEHRREALNLRLQAQTGQLENTARIRVVRRELARLETENTARRKQSN